MKKIVTAICLFITTQSAKADLFGGDLPLLAQIVTNTLYTMYELQRQSQLMNDELRGLNDKIYRIKTIQDVVQPDQWGAWKDPNEALRRLQLIYHTLPKEYRNEKSDLVESEISKAMNLISKVSVETKSTFDSGKELESKALFSSPAVAQKLSASGVGTLISQQAQSQVIQSHVVSLLAQMLAEGHEKDTRLIASRGNSFIGLSNGLSQKQNKFSEIVFGIGRLP